MTRRGLKLGGWAILGGLCLGPWAWAAWGQEATPTPAEELADRRDEVALAELQVEIRKANIEEAEARFNRAQALLDLSKQRHERATEPFERVIEAQGELASATAALRVRRAELKEAEIRLQQAMRSASPEVLKLKARRDRAMSHLEQLRRVISRPDDPSLIQAQKTLRELESRYEEALKELARQSQAQDASKLSPDRVGELERENERLRREIEELRRAPSPAERPEAQVPAKAEADRDGERGDDADLAQLLEGDEELSTARMRRDQAQKNYSQTKKVVKKPNDPSLTRAYEQVRLESDRYDRLLQAKLRVVKAASIQRPKGTEPEAQAPARPAPDRIDELERKLERLLRELDESRREPRPAERPQAPPKDEAPEKLGPEALDRSIRDLIEGKETSVRDLTRAAYEMALGRKPTREEMRVATELAEKARSGKLTANDALEALNQAMSNARELKGRVSELKTEAAIRKAREERQRYRDLTEQMRGAEGNADRVVSRLFDRAKHREPTEAERETAVEYLEGAKSAAERAERLDDLIWALVVGAEDR
jgi:hypothetical protein